MITLCGVDFSMNSTAACKLSDAGYEFFSFPRSRKANKFPWNEVPSLTVTDQNSDKKFTDYQTGEEAKLRDAMDLSRLIIDTISSNDSGIHCAMEGISFGSRGSSFLDIVGYSWILRREALLRWTNMPRIFAPGTIKKVAGSGKYKKWDMIQAFLRSEDPLLQEHPFWLWCRSLDEKQLTFKPLDDCADSWWILKTLEQDLQKNGKLP